MEEQGEEGSSTVVGDIRGCETAEDGEGTAVETAVIEDREPLLCGERGGGLHYGGHGVECESCILTWVCFVSRCICVCVCF